MPVSTAKAAKSCNKKPTLNRQNPINFSSFTSYFSNLFEPRLPFPILGVNSPWKMPPEVFKALQTLGPTHRPLLSHLWCFPPSPLGPTPPPSDPALPPAPPPVLHMFLCFHAGPFACNTLPFPFVSPWVPLICPLGVGLKHHLPQEALPTLPCQCVFTAHRLSFLASSSHLFILGASIGLVHNRCSANDFWL